METETKEEKRKKYRKEYYEKNKDVARKNAKKRYARKMLEEGKVVKPHGRPRKYESLEQHEEAIMDEVHVRYYVKKIKKGDGYTPRIDDMSYQQKYDLLAAFLKVEQIKKNKSEKLIKNKQLSAK